MPRKPATRGMPRPPNLSSTWFAALLAAILVALQAAPARAQLFVAGPAAAAAGAPIALSLPLVRGGSVLGDVEVQIDGSGGASIESGSVRLQFAKLLNEGGKARLDAAVAGHSFVGLSELRASGLDLEYNASKLEVLIRNIEPTLLATQRIDEPVRESSLPVAPMSDVSAYLNLSLNLEHSSHAGGFRNPDLFMFGAVRAGKAVFELDGGFTDTLEKGFRFHRRAARVVYDEPDKLRRYSAGDLRLSSLPLFGTQFIGGAAVEKRRRIFDPMQPLAQLGGRQVMLDTPSTVEVFVNGSRYRSMNLQPGAYDLADLPLQYGSNDVEILVRDAAGRTQRTRFGYFFDPIDVAPGDDEYVAAIGVMPRRSSFQPVYSGDPVFTGHYRRALNHDVAIGAAVQLTKGHRVIGAEARLVPQILPGAFDLQAAMSLDGDRGYAVRAGYRWAGSDSARAQRLTLSLDYESAHFRLLGQPPGKGGGHLALNASYSQHLGPRTAVTAGLSYASRSGRQRVEKGGFVELHRQFNHRLRGTVGAEYGEGGFQRRNVGVRASVSMSFGNGARADAAYESRRGTVRAGYSRSPEGYAGSFGYDVTMQRSPGSTSADASATYIGDRFDARLSLLGSGRDLRDFGGRQTTRLQIGTSAAFADGTFGVGRPIADSFMLVRPHKTLGDTRVITGRDLHSARREGRSGALGAAVIPHLSSYVPRNILYDIEATERAYDIGSGVVRVDPPYRSGGVFTVGNDRFVSALGNLEVAGTPAALVSGRITSADDKTFEPQPFFTNSTGRFAVAGLAPGKTYCVQLSNGRSFSIPVPKDNDGLLRLGTLNLPGPDT